MRKFIRVVVIVLGIAALGLWAVDYYYTPQADKFPANTSINGIDVSDLSIKEAEEKLSEEWCSKDFTFEYKGKSYQVPMKDLSFDMDLETPLTSPDLYEKMRILLKRGNSYTVQMWADQSQKFLTKIADLPFCDNSKKEPTKDAYIDLSNFDFKVIKEKIGTEVDPHIIMNIARSDIAYGVFSEELEEDEIIRQPEITADSDEIAEKLDYYNENLFFKVAYNIDGEPEVIKPADLDEMVTYTEDGPKFHKKRIKAYIKDIAGRFNEFGETYNFRTHSGNTIQVKSVTFGKYLDQDAMYSDLKNALKKQKNKTLEVKWALRKYSEEAGIGNSYVEVSISGQHVWCYKDGKCVVDCDCVTGAPGHDTARGVFTIQYVTGPTVLRGDNGDGSRYESPVNCFMPFYNGQGLHGSNGWRTAWGGQIYKTAGSHGCVNCPDDAAKKMAGIVSAGYPVVIY